MTSFQLSNLLDKYIKGHCSEEEIAIVDQWYQSKENQPEYLDNLSPSHNAILKKRMLDRMVNKIEAENSHLNDDAVKVKMFPPAKKWWIGIAAASIVLILIKVLIFNPQHQHQKNGQVESVIHYTNNTQKIIKQTLADGSLVWLKPNAMLSVPKAFNKASRTVSMDGECFFEITKNPSSPFIIKSAHIITKVWGTSFKVIDYSKSAQAVVKVITGKVSVSKKNETVESNTTQLTKGEVMLQPNQKATYDGINDALSTTSRTDMQDMDLWKHINLSYDHTKFSTIVKELNTRFNANIKIQDNHLKDEEMTADFSGLNLPEVLEVLKASMSIDYEISGEQITLIKPINK
ncbi:FecR family protein [Pedobacter sp. R20-19]|uniref:FecR family protein n=1 Tax=Pedobacter sp. R20-19 TaxID=1270196 RepID=UPI000493B12D|nr:FecR family protein [Pedobacter sp. R20-19]